MNNRKVLNIDDFISKDELGVIIADMNRSWNNLRAPKLREWKEIQEYIFATDTTTTANASLPWSNTTTIPKTTQIRDNLFANYMSSMFPKRKWLEWQGGSEEDDSMEKTEAIEGYMSWVTDQEPFIEEQAKLIYDYIDYGNAFSMVEWVDDRIISEKNNGISNAYVGPVVRRISPTDIVFNPYSTSFEDSPKIITSITSMGDIAKQLKQLSQSEDERQAAENLMEYLTTVRSNIREADGNIQDKDHQYQIAGFGSLQEYLDSGYVEVLTFYGDIYDSSKNELLENYVIKVADRHKIISMVQADTLVSKPSIYHVGWRVRPDNLWAMGPLDNLIGIQYRIDHVENSKADILDMTAHPVVKIKGEVEDFVWQPAERIYVGDEGDVQIIGPDVQALALDNELMFYENKMEEMAGSPREAMGIRTPGEKTKFEVQTLQNASSRVFQSKIAQFERKTERELNAMLELSRKNMDETTIRVFDTEAKVASFESLTSEDITGVGRIRPVAARHFAEKAQIVQDLNNFFQSPSGQDPEVRQHFSAEKMATMWEQLLDLQDFKLVQPYVRLTERAQSERITNSQQEQVSQEISTPTGLYEDDFDPELEEDLSLQDGQEEII